MHKEESVYRDIQQILAAMHKEESVYRDIQQACESLGFLCQLATSLDQCVATSCSYLPHVVILAAMHKEESVYRDIQQACESLGFLCQLATSLDQCVATSCSYLPHVVVIEVEKTPEPGAIRSMKRSHHVILVALRKKPQIIYEQPGGGSGLNWSLELQAIEQNDVYLRNLLAHNETAFCALDKSRDLVYITNQSHSIQYVNKSCCSVLGYSQDELLNKFIANFHQLGQMDQIIRQLDRGFDWEGKVSWKCKNGDTIPLHCKALPFCAFGRDPTHFIYIQENPLDFHNLPRGSVPSIRKGSYDLKSINSEGAQSARRQSLAKLHNLPLEAPITKVISLISAAQEHSSDHVINILDKVIDILRTTELYSSHVKAENLRCEDPVTSDLIGALISQGPAPVSTTRRSSNDSANVKSTHAHTHPHGSAAPSGKSLNMVASPQMKELLTTSLAWDFNIFQLEHLSNKRGLERDTYKVARQSIIDMVLATEMTKHFEHLAKFVSVFNTPTPSSQHVECDYVQQDGGQTKSPSSDCGPDEDYPVSSPEAVNLVRRMLIKCADVANPTRPLPLCVEWGRRIAEEYFAQTDEEKALKLPVVMPMFDRVTCSIPKSQMGFVDFIINDMFEAWDAFIDMPEMLYHLRSNYQYWKDLDEKGITSIQDIYPATGPAELTLKSPTSTTKTTTTTTKSTTTKPPLKSAPSTNSQQSSNNPSSSANVNSNGAKVSATNPSSSAKSSSASSPNSGTLSSSISATNSTSSTLAQNSSANNSNSTLSQSISANNANSGAKTSTNNMSANNNEISNSGAKCHSTNNNNNTEARHLQSGQTKYHKCAVSANANSVVKSSSATKGVAKLPGVSAKGSAALLGGMHNTSMSNISALPDIPETNKDGLERDTYKVARQSIIDMVLATEMTKHFEHLAKFVSVFNTPTPSSQHVECDFVQQDGGQTK
ncbi:high affinity cAMP-specific and IBMX-insensitive 3',5'-cyclic phosphodiesterase 8B-like, partial [Diaphorina citri]|uniref:High affinity cAMP-specific and IBMX-insensitive 3',5'-cyclic phosphodiesterase 8B-like n=1 Tax=Diaphorina citri TaxID=121845 RepID=A0A3Q0JHV1_DIACI